MGPVLSISIIGLYHRQMGGFIGILRKVGGGRILYGWGFGIRLFWLILVKRISDIRVELHGSCMWFSG